MGVCSSRSNQVVAFDESADKTTQIRDYPKAVTHEASVKQVLQERSKNKTIDKILNTAQTEEDQKVKVLILGTGGCGKSTFFKQLKIMHINGFTEEERNSFRNIIYDNTITSIKALIHHAMTMKIEVKSETTQSVIQRITNPVVAGIHLGMKDDLIAVWNDPDMQQVFSQRHQFPGAFMDSARYFLEKINEIFVQDYIPSNEDILHARAATTGIRKVNFRVDGANFEVYDVGGQRGERKKWLHCFDKVTSILYMAALSEYDEMLEEDQTQNRMLESLHVFRGICSMPWFSQTPIILFLNKADIFEEKIVVKRRDLSSFFPEYEGPPCDFRSAAVFVREMFLACDPSENRSIYSHFTIATSTTNIDNVWKSSQHIIMEQSLQKANLL